jgi:Trypsin-like peptidase domain
MEKLRPVRLAALAVAMFVCAWPVSAIVVADPSTDPTYTGVLSYGDTAYGINFSGVVQVTGPDGGCSGSLLSDGVHILTAGHCVLGATAPGLTVTFQGPSGPVGATVSSFQTEYAGDPTLGTDVAVLTLSQPAPSFAARYSVYDGATPLSTQLVLAGYGYGGTGAAGSDGVYGTLREGTNEYEGDGYDFFGYSYNLLVGEFYDSSTPSTDVLGCEWNPIYFNACSSATPYTANDEADIGFGDSGGPTFYDGQIIGIHDLVGCASPADSSVCSIPPSEGTVNNSYFGQIFADVSAPASLGYIEGVEGIPEPGTAALALGAVVFMICLRGLRRQYH